MKDHDADISTGGVRSDSRRSFSKVDAKRMGQILAIVAVLATAYWFLLPAIQSLILPEAIGGTTGPWVVRPILAFHFSAVGALSAVTGPLLIGPLQRTWKREDAALGGRFDPFHNHPGRLRSLLVKGFFGLVLFILAVPFYLHSWTVIGPNGIEEHLPWTTRIHSYEDVVALERIPEGYRSEPLLQNGPWYSIEVKNGPSITLSEENEGTSRDELSAIASYIAARSGLAWKRRGDARAR